MECYGKLRNMFHSTDGVEVIMHDVDFIPGLGLNYFPVDTALKAETVTTLDKTRAYLMEGWLLFSPAMASEPPTATRPRSLCRL